MELVPPNEAIDQIRRARHLHLSSCFVPDLCEPSLGIRRKELVLRDLVEHSALRYGTHAPLVMVGVYSHLGDLPASSPGPVDHGRSKRTCFQNKSRFSLATYLMKHRHYTH